MKFDPLLVNVERIEEGDLLKQKGASTYFSPGTIDNNSGIITGVAGTITSPGETITSPGDFAVITLTAKEKEGTSSLNLLNVIVGDAEGKPVSIRVAGGSVTIILYEAWGVNHDKKVNVLDMIRIGQHWGEVGEKGWIPEDVNRDGRINVLDMILIGQHWTG